MKSKPICLLVAISICITMIGCSKNKENSEVKSNINQLQTSKVNYMEEGSIYFSKSDLKNAIENFDKVNLDEITDIQKLKIVSANISYGRFDKAQYVINSMKDKSFKSQFKDTVDNARLEYKEEEYLYRNAEDIINNFLNIESKYLHGIMDKSGDSKTLFKELMPCLSSNSTMRTSFKFIQESGQVSMERFYKNLSARYDEVKEVKLESDKKAIIHCDRYYNYTQTDIIGFFICRVDYKLVKEGDKWLIEEVNVKERPVIIENDMKLKDFSLEYKYKDVISKKLKVYNDSYKNVKIINCVEYETKGKTQAYVTYEIDVKGEKFIYTIQISPKQNKFVMRDGRNIESSDKYILDDYMIMTIKGTEIVDKETFLKLYDKVREVLIKEKPTAQLYSDKNPIITAMLKKKNIYYVIYYDRYNTNSNCAELNIAEFIKNGDKLELKSNSNGGSDLH